MVKTDPPTVADFLSHIERGIPLRNNDPETLRLASGVSTMNSEAGARATAMRYPRMGRYIAALDVPADGPLTYEQTGISGHYTLWGDPALMLECVQFVVSV